MLLQWCLLLLLLLLLLLNALNSNGGAGGQGHGVPLSEQDQWICTEIKPTLVENGIIFAGIDVIGNYLTEINITSPTCIRELDAQYDLNICATLFDHIESLLN